MKALFENAIAQEEKNKKSIELNIRDRKIIKQRNIILSVLRHLQFWVFIV